MKRIIVCDSGLGGLNIAARFFTEKPAAEPCELLYFNVYPAIGKGFNDLPSGSAREDVFRSVLKCMETFSPDLCVIACNTLSIVNEHLRLTYRPPFPLSGIVDAAVDSMSEALAADETASLLILGTLTTVGSDLYARRLRARGFAPERIRSLACPGLATLLDSGPASPEAGTFIAGLADKARTLFDGMSGPLLLGLCCTHFGFAAPFWEREFTRVFGNRVRLIDPNSRPPVTFSAKSFRYFSRVEFFPGARENMSAYFRGCAPVMAEGLLKAQADPDLFEFHPEKYGLREGNGAEKSEKRSARS